MPNSTTMSASEAVPRKDPVSPLVQRLVESSGIFFAVLLFVAFLLGGETPDTGDPVAEWTEFARDNESNLRISALVFGVAAYNFLLFLGVVRAVLGDAEQAARGFTRGGYIVLAAGTAGIVGMTLAIGISTVGLSDPDTPPEVLRAFEDLAGAAWVLASAGIGAWLVTIGLLNAGLRPLPSWLGYVALAGGICWVLQLGVLLSEDQDNAFGIFYPLGFLLLIVFCIGASVTMLRRPPR